VRIRSFSLQPGKIPDLHLRSERRRPPKGRLTGDLIPNAIFDSDPRFHRDSYRSERKHAQEPSSTDRHTATSPRAFHSGKEGRRGQVDGETGLMALSRVSGITTGARGHGPAWSHRSESRSQPVHTHCQIEMGVLHRRTRVRCRRRSGAGRRRWRGSGSGRWPGGWRRRGTWCRRSGSRRRHLLGQSRHSPSGARVHFVAHRQTEQDHGQQDRNVGEPHIRRREARWVPWVSRSHDFVAVRAAQGPT
jgi:hypothetical protein